jgi:hypothetical protein
MALKVQQLHEAKSLTTGANSTLSLPVGGKIHNLMLRFAQASGADATVAAIKSEISNIRLAINGEDFVNASPTDLFDILTFLGQRTDAPAGIASILELNLARLVYSKEEERDLFGFGTDNVQSIQVTITAGTLSTISTVQAITSREAIRENLGLAGKILKFPVSYNSTGDHTMDTLPRDPDLSYLAILVNPGASGVIVNSECRVNSSTIKEKCPVSANKQILSADGYTQPTGHFVHGFTDGSVKSRLPLNGVADFRLITNFSTAPGAAGYWLLAVGVKNMPSNL